MKNCSSLMRKKWKLLSFVLLLQLVSVIALAQVSIHGKVTDKDGSGLSGISVLVRGTTSGTVTDADGTYNFSVNLKTGTYTLTFSGIGFKTKEQSIAIGSGTEISSDATLETDPLSMDEVVVTGTSQGTTRRQLGSFISTIKGDQLSKSTTGNVLAALQGKSPGAQIIQNSGDPGGSMSVRLRGAFIYYRWRYRKQQRPEGNKYPKRLRRYYFACT